MKNKVKPKKPTKNMKQALESLSVESNKEKPNKADTLNYLGFTTRKLGDLLDG